MILAYPYLLVLVVLLPLPFLVLVRNRYLAHSNSRLLAPLARFNPLRYAATVLSFAALCVLVFALARPLQPNKEATQTEKSRDNVVTVDISGSMAAFMPGSVPKFTEKDPELDKDLPGRPPPRLNGRLGPPDERGKGQRRIDHAQYALLKFVRVRYQAKKGDRISIFGFDEQPHLCWPLTHDLKQIYRHGLFLPEAMGGGTNFSRNPGPIDAAIEQFRTRGKSRTRVLIMITDGEDHISWLDMKRLAHLITSENVHFYLIGVGETLVKRDVDIIQLAQQVGGQVYRVENANDLDKCFEDIDRKERYLIDIQSRTRHEELFFHFAGAAGVLYLLSLVCNFLFPRQ